VNKASSRAQESPEGFGNSVRKVSIWLPDWCLWSYFRFICLLWADLTLSCHLHSSFSVLLVETTDFSAARADCVVLIQFHKLKFDLQSPSDVLEHSHLRMVSLIQTTPACLKFNNMQRFGARRKKRLNQFVATVVSICFGLVGGGISFRRPRRLVPIKNDGSPVLVPGL
jgi:hypothetical protein